jgi:Protein of unknown function (DUF2924)
MRIRWVSPIWNRYRLQEIAHGGLGKATRRKLQTMAKALRTTGRVGPTPNLSLKPGARLVREWRGRTHTVTVTEDGFSTFSRELVVYGLFQGVISASTGRSLSL